MPALMAAEPESATVPRLTAKRRMLEAETVAAEWGMALHSVYAAKSRVLRRLRDELAALGVME